MAADVGFKGSQKFESMAVLAHPGDESLGFGGTLVNYAG
jgi:LmbE family N-acetylglucosaminyl deacetylase